MNKIPYKDLPECTLEKQKEYQEKAVEAIKYINWYGDVKSVAILALMDYMACSDGTKLIRR